MLVINPGIQKNKGKVKKGLRQTELHSMSLWLLLRGAVHPESSPAGRNGKGITDGQNPVCSYSAVDMTLNMVSCSRPSTFLQPFPALSFSFVSPPSLLLPGYSPTLYPRPKLSPLSSQPQHLNHNLPSKSGSFFWDKPKSLLLQEDMTDHFSLQRSRSPEFTEPTCHSFDK